MKNKSKKIESTVLINMIQYLILIIMGTFLMIYPQVGILEPNYYISIIYYIFTFITCLFYFIGRRKGDYENIILSLINVIVASYLFLMQKNTNSDVLGIAVSGYTILVIFNKMYSAYRLKSTNNILWGIKYLTSLLLAFLGVLTMFNLFNDISVVTLMFGYYFIVFGIINFMECLVEALLELNGIKIFLEYIESAEVKKKTKKLITKEPVAVKEKIKEEPKKAEEVKKTIKKVETKVDKPKIKVENKKEVKPKVVVKKEKKVETKIKKPTKKVIKAKKTIVKESKKETK